MGFERLAAWSVRAVQMDLARQMETVPNVIAFAQRSADAGFNTLLLYLEARVRTESFPHRAESESYSLDDMRQVVEACDKLGMEVVPCVATLGHAEQFLACEAMQPLANPAGPGTFDTANEQVYAFLERYLGELATVFGSTHLHLGCDEAWWMGQSPGELERRAQGASYGDIFIGHVQRIHELAAKLGKRMWLWDDLLEYLTQAEIESLPRDIVWCAWHYDADHIAADGTRGHFNNLERHDWLALYEKLGVDALIAPSVQFPHGTEALMRWAKGHRVAGGLLTQWELSTAQLPLTWLPVEVTGRLWRAAGKGEDATGSLVFQREVDEAIERLLPQADEATLGAIEVLLTPLGWPVRYPLDAEKLSHHPFDQRAWSALRTAAMLRDTLMKATAQAEGWDESARRLLREYEVMARIQVVSGRTHRLVDALLEDVGGGTLTAEQQCELTWLREELKELEALREKDTQALRPGLSDRCASMFRQLRERLNEWVAVWEATAVEDRLVVSLELFLWDGYSAPQLTVELLGADGQWRTVLTGCRKPLSLNDGLFTARQWVAWQGGPATRLRATVGGFGGQGIAFAKLVHGGGVRLVPTQVESSDGLVRDAEHLLTDDSTVTFLGNPRTAEAVMDRSKQRDGVVEVALG